MRNKFIQLLRQAGMQIDLNAFPKDKEFESPDEMKEAVENYILESCVDYMIANGATISCQTNDPLTYEEAVAAAGKEALYVVLHNGCNACFPAFVQEEVTILGREECRRMIVVWNSIMSASLEDIDRTFSLYRRPVMKQK